MLATQSTLLLDSLARPEDVTITELVDGATRLRRLDSQALAEWLKDYTLGDLWEKNVLGGRPRP